MSSGTEPHVPSRVLGRIDATCIVIGAIVGVGIFFTPSLVAERAGSVPIAMLVWAIAGLIALLGALTFAELGAMYPRNGGQYEILRDAFGPMIGFVFVFCNATAIQTGAIAIIALICANHIGIAVADIEPEGFALLAIATAVIVSLIVANIVGVRWGSRIQNLTVYTKLLALVAVVGVAVYFTGQAPAVAASDPVTASRFGVAGAIGAGLVAAFFAFGGWQHALWIAGEVRNPARNLPLAIVGGVLIVIAIYLLANWAFFDLLGHAGVAKTKVLASDAVSVAFPGLGKRLVAGAVAVSAFGVLNAQLLSGPRLVYGMARDGRFFYVFSKLHRVFHTPYAAISLLGGLALILLIAGGEERIGLLLTGVIFIDAVFFVFTGVALIRLRRTRPDADRPVRVPVYPLVPVLFILGELAIAVGAYLDPETRKAAFIGAAWIAAAAVLYAVRFRERRTGSTGA